MAIDLGLSRMVERVTVETNVTPPIVINAPLAGGGGSVAPGFLVKLLRPQVTVRALGSDYTVAPYGKPRALWPLFAGAAAVGLVVAVVLVTRGIRK